jgi:hypothetical protein
MLCIKNLNTGDYNSAGKRRLGENTQPDVSSLAKRPRTTTEVLLPTSSVTSSTSTSRLRSAAYDCWNSAIGCDSEQPPEGIDRATIVVSDAEYQRSKAFTDFRHPINLRVRCIHCM